MQRNVGISSKLLLVALVLLSTDARGDDGAKPKKEQAKEAKLKERLLFARTALEPLAEKYQPKYRTYLELRAAEIRRVCSLSENQVRKLEIGVKGATQSFMDNWLDAVAKWVLVNNGNLNVPDEQIKAYADDDNFSQYDMGLGVSLASELMSREAIWQKLLTKTLTKEQIDTWLTTVKKRKLEAVDSNVTAMMANIDREYLLSPQQQENLRPIIVDSFKEKQVKVYLGSPLGTFMASIRLYLSYNEQVEKLLAPTQRKLWKQHAKKFEMYGAMDDADLIGPWSGLVFPDKLEEGLKGLLDQEVQAAEDAAAEPAPNAYDAEAVEEPAVTAEDSPAPD